MIFDLGVNWIHLFSYRSHLRVIWGSFNKEFSEDNLGLFFVYCPSVFRVNGVVLYRFCLLWECSKAGLLNNREFSDFLVGLSGFIVILSNFVCYFSFYLNFFIFYSSFFLLWFSNSCWYSRMFRQMLLLPDVYTQTLTAFSIL